MNRRARSVTPNDAPWWKADEGKVHERALPYVQTVERAQSDHFDRFVKLAALYDPNSSAANGNDRRAEERGLVSENVVASNVDTVTAIIAATAVRARFMTDDASWSEQRQAKHLEWYAEGLATKLKIHDKCRLAFKDAALKGTGLLKCYVDGFDEIRVERVLVDDIIVDEAECRRGGSPKQMHQRLLVDREELIAQFPEAEDQITRAMSRQGERWANYRPIAPNELVALESWRLPIGRRGRKGYVAGRHSITIDGYDLLDEEWHKPTFPIVRIVWVERVNSWYGISLAERIAGIQRALNRRNLQIERQLDQGAFPTTFVQQADAKLAVQSTNRIGSISVYRASKPETVIPQAVSNETYKSRIDLRDASFEESGVSRMASQAAKPSGIDSGVAMREYRDQTTQRFSQQEKGHETLTLDVILAVIDCCKDLGKLAPPATSSERYGRRRIEWSKVDMGDVAVQIAAASTLARTPAGRIQTVIEWAQAGIVSQDSARRLMDHPDLEGELSMYTAALESAEWCIERVLDGEQVMPEPYMNLQMLQWRAQMEYLKIQTAGAPEDILEGLRQMIVQAAYMLNPPQPANANMAGSMAGSQPNAGAMPGDPPPAVGNVAITASPMYLST